MDLSLNQWQFCRLKLRKSAASAFFTLQGPQASPSSSLLAMPLSPAEKAEMRYRQALERGEEPPPPRTDANRALLEEVRAEVEQGKASIRAQASKGVKRVRQVSAEEEARLKEELNADGARIKEELKAEGAAQRRLMAEETAALAACPLGRPPGILWASAAGHHSGRLGRRQQQRWSRAASRTGSASRSTGRGARACADGFADRRPFRNAPHALRGARAGSCQGGHGRGPCSSGEEPGAHTEGTLAAVRPKLCRCR